ncbi:unnamed protein product [Peronospora farinosa]|uniref:Uncharacterized protein n=1 Tax=Peronospora farinosa TaxID=134698 RepID=A0AAV0USM0_9STRA|nr:unnamed protein product [Peronospora farinosa]
MAAKKRKQSGHAKVKKKAQIKKVLDVQERSDNVQQETQKCHANTEQDGVSLKPENAVFTAITECSGLLSAELVQKMGGEDAGGALVLPGHREKKQKTELMSEELLQQAQQMSKSKRKKMEVIAAKKIKEARRADIYKSLEKQQLSQDQMKLMYSTSQMGHKETLRERLKRSMNRQKAGIAISEDAMNELLKKTNRSEEEEEEEEEEEKDDEELVEVKSEKINVTQHEEQADDTVATLTVVKTDKTAMIEDVTQEKGGKRKRRKKK